MNKQITINRRSKMGFDDAGCDWYTDDDGSIYINNDGDWLFEYNNPNLAALVDAANIIGNARVINLPMKIDDALTGGYLDTRKFRHLLRNAKNVV